MHPKYKLEYYRAKGWKKKWIQQAEDIVREIWTRDYLPHVKVKEVRPSVRMFNRAFDLFNDNDNVTD